MPAKKPRPKDEKPQRERFEETAKRLGADGPKAKKTFERAVDKVLPAKKG